MYKHFYLLVFLFSILSCKKDSIKNPKRTYFYENGNISTEYEYLIKNGDTILDGEFKGYYPNGKLRFIGIMEHDVSISSINYYINGNIESKKKYVEDESIEEQYYRESGTIEEYLVRDKFERVRYLKKYDSLGKTTSTQGDPIIELLLDGNESPNFKISNNDLINIRLFDTIKFTYTIANPPNSKVNFKVIEKKSNNKLLDVEVKTPHNTFYKVFKEKKELELLGIVEMHDFEKNSIIRDTISTKILWDR